MQEQAEEEEGHKMEHGTTTTRTSSRWRGSGSGGP
jgi:hypothetical protein